MIRSINDVMSLSVYVVFCVRYLQYILPGERSDGLIKGDVCVFVYSVRLHFCSLPDVETQIQMVIVILCPYLTGTGFCTPLRYITLRKLIYGN